MTFVATQGLWLPMPPPPQTFATTFVSGTIDATGEKFAFIGRYWNKDRTSRDITKVGFRFGTVVKAGGSALTVSLQDVDLVNGPPFQPDGTQDQTVAIANGNAAFVSNTWIQTDALSANRTVAFGDLLAVVIEYDGGGRLGADTVGIASWQTISGACQDLLSGASLFTASWANVSQAQSSVILEDTTGGFGTLGLSTPIASLTTPAYTTGTTPDEVALRFTVPFACKVDGGWVNANLASAATFDVVLYEGTSELATVSVDVNTVMGISAARLCQVWFSSEITLTAGTEYFLAIKPTTANNVTILYETVSAAGHFDAHPGGQNFHWGQRTDAGAWSTTTTRRLLAGLHVSAVHDGAGSGGGGLHYTNMMRGNVG